MSPVVKIPLMWRAPGSSYRVTPCANQNLAASSSGKMRFTPRVEDTFTLYRKTLSGMVIVFQIPTFVFVLARMRVVTSATSVSVRRTANSARQHTPRPRAALSATRGGRDPRAASRRVLVGGDRPVRPHQHDAPQLDGRTAQ